MASQNTVSSDKRTHVLLDLPAEYQFLSIISASVAALLDNQQIPSAGEMLNYQVQLGVHETCTNIIEHAYAGISGRIEVVMEIDDNPSQLVINLYDTGKSFVLSEFIAPNFNEPSTSGYGLFIIHELLDSVRYEPQPGKNHWRLVKYL